MRTASTIFLIGTFTLGICLTASANATLTNCATLTSSLWGNGPVNADFDVTASVAIPPGDLSISFLICDNSGGTTLWYERAPHHNANNLRAGDVVRLKGRILAYPQSGRYVAWSALNVLSHGVPPKPCTCTATQLLAGELRHTYIQMKASIKDAFRDEIDPDYLFLTLVSDGELLYAAIYDKNNSLNNVGLVGATALISGSVYDNSRNRRDGISRNLGAVICIPSRNDIKILSTPDTEINTLPHADELLALRPADVPNAGKFQVQGWVLAVWHGGHILLRTRSGLVSRIDLSQKDLPNVGDSITVCGFPASDLFNINLIRATWQPAAPLPYEEVTAEPITAADISLDDQSQTCFKPAFHGRLLKIKGVVRQTSSSNIHDGILRVEDNGIEFIVDASNCRAAMRGITENCRISITGICVLDIEDWRPNEAFPRIKGFFIVPRTPADILVLSHPPWLTPVRLMWALVIVCIVLILSAMLNIALRKILSRRERELESEIVARVGSDLRIRERTRLAIELHDSVSQNLTGVALELQTVAKSKAPLPPDIQHHLDVAKSALGSCRDELRRCLWDLRNDMLDEQDVATAISRTVLPHIGNTHLAIRFAVSRDLLTDNTLHAILRAIRELVINAVRHGEATSVRIAGSIEDGKLLFSVTDNGTGFDPDNCPGIADGHYGLLGISERFTSLGGSFKITSQPGITKAVCTIPLHGTDQT